MKQELLDVLFQRYPKIFSELHKWQDDAYRKINVGSGRFELIDTLCADIQFYIDHNEVPQVEATQLKEKCGTLRFRFRGGDERVAGMVQMAESMSAHLCEECGAPGKKCEAQGIQTLCDAHVVQL